MLLSEHRPHTRNGGNNVISPLINSYEAEARFLSGDFEGALDILRKCFGTMLNKGAETFWEFAPADTQARWDVPSHGWSGGCTYVLSAYVLGIRPEADGYEEIHFEPYAGFDSFRGVVPTKHGLIAVSCETKGEEKIYTLAVPDNIPVKAVLPENSKLIIKNY